MIAQVVIELADEFRHLRPRNLWFYWHMGDPQRGLAGWTNLGQGSKSATSISENTSVPGPSPSAWIDELFAARWRKT